MTQKITAKKSEWTQLPSDDEDTNFLLQNMGKQPCLIRQEDGVTFNALTDETTGYTVPGGGTKASGVIIPNRKVFIRMTLKDEEIVFDTWRV